MSQAEHILAILSDYERHDRDALCDAVYGQGTKSARLAARIDDLRRKGHIVIGGTYEGERTRYWYKLEKKEVPQVVLKQTPAKQHALFSLPSMHV